MYVNISIRMSAKVREWRKRPATRLAYMRHHLLICNATHSHVT